MSNKLTTAGYYEGLQVGNPLTGRLDYKAFVDTYVNTNGDRKAAMQAAGLELSDTPNNWSSRALEILGKAEVRRAIAERAADQFFAQLPLGTKVLTDVLANTEDPSFNMTKLKVHVALKLFELAQVKELATKAIGAKLATKKIDVNDLAERLLALGNQGIVTLPSGEIGTNVGSRFAQAEPVDGDSANAAEDHESSELQTVSEAETATCPIVRLQAEALSGGEPLR